MVFYLEEEEVWKCPKHPSKRRRTGICPTCLRDRLATLCPECANVRPCSCSAATSSSSTPSSVSRLSLAGDAATGLKRSRSVAIPFLRSKSKFHSGDGEFDRDGASVKDFSGLTRSRSTRWFWSMFKPPKSNWSGVQEQNCQRSVVVEDYVKSVDGKAATLMKSRSVAVAGGVGEMGGAKKRRGWKFPSPMKAFRQSNRTSKILQEAVACA